MVRQVRWFSGLVMAVGAGIVAAGASVLDSMPVLFDVAVCVGALMILGGLISIITAGNQVAEMRRKQLLRTGLPARATVRRLADTGTSQNDNPQVILHLLVTPDNGAPAFESRARQVVPRLDIPRPGWQTSVRYDPADPDTVAVYGPITEPTP